MNTDLLLEPQKQHAINLLNSLYINGVAVDLSETGTGKSYVATWIAKHLNNPVVIICPKVVISAWNSVLQTFGIKAHTVINYEKLVRGCTEYVSFNNMHVNSDEYISIKFPKNSLIIVDESHKCKGWNSKNSEMLIALKKQGYKLLLLSATAATNPLEMKSFGFVTTLHNLSNYRNFLTVRGVYTIRVIWRHMGRRYNY